MGSEAWPHRCREPPAGWEEQQERGNSLGAEGDGFPINVPNLHSWLKMRMMLGRSLLVSVGSVVEYQGGPGREAFPALNQIPISESPYRRVSPGQPGGPTPAALRGFTGTETVP